MLELDVVCKIGQTEGQYLILEIYSKPKTQNDPIGRSKADF